MYISDSLSVYKIIGFNLMIFSLFRNLYFAVTGEDFDNISQQDSEETPLLKTKTGREAHMSVSNTNVSVQVRI